MKENYGSYTKIYDFMITKLKLAKIELLVYAYIFSMTINGEGYWGSQQTLANRFGTCRKTIVDVLKKLVDNGLLIKEDSTTAMGKCCIYTVDLDKI